MFKGDTGKVRKVLAKFGMNPEKTIFNDKRKEFRRIKIYKAESGMTDKFSEAISKEFGDRFIMGKIMETKSVYPRKSFVIYLAN